MPPDAESSRSRAAVADLAVVVGIVALFGGVLHLARDWERPLRESTPIDLDLVSLAGYTLNSLVRGWLAYACSLGFTLAVAVWAHRDARARRFILPTLDVLQSLPVLGFMPGLVFALVALFPQSNIGLELACILMIFTGQVWNMTFSLYDSLRSVPPDFHALAKLHRYTPAQVFWRIELPYAARGLVYNSMVSMAGGWFFLSINEAFRLGDHDFRLPGLGAYMSVAVEQGDVIAQISGIVCMALVIVGVDRLIWWPLTLWSARFRMDDFGGQTEAPPPWCRSLAEARVTRSLTAPLQRWLDRPRSRAPLPAVGPDASPPGWKRLGLLAQLLLGAAVAAGAVLLVRLLGQVAAAEWWELGGDTLLTGMRVAASLVLGTLWTIPVGVAIGLNPRLARKVQPWVQFAASFPAPMIYPWLLALMAAAGLGLGWGAIPLILLGTQWYILFNVIAAAAAIPQELRCAADLMHLSGWRRWRLFLLPALFPGLVTGWIAAAGGAWNATIVAEYVHLGKEIHVARGLGAFLAQATEAGRYPAVAAAAAVMALCVVAINLVVWRPLQALAQERCRILS